MPILISLACVRSMPHYSSTTPITKWPGAQKNPHSMSESGPKFLNSSLQASCICNEIRRWNRWRRAIFTYHHVDLVLFVFEHEDKMKLDLDVNKVLLNGFLNCPNKSMKIMFSARQNMKSMFFRKLKRWGRSVAMETEVCALDQNWRPQNDPICRQ